MQFKIDDELTHSRLLSLQQYLDQICASSTLRHSPELFTFLTDTTNQDISAISKPSPMIPKPENFISSKTGEPMKVSDLLYPGGKINLLMNGQLRAITREISIKVDTLLPLEQLASKICIDVIDSYERLAKMFSELEGICGKISEAYADLNTFAKLPNIGVMGDIYESLKNVIHKQSNGLVDESKNFRDSIRGMFDFSIQELNGIISVSVCF